MSICLNIHLLHVIYVLQQRVMLITAQVLMSSLIGGTFFFFFCQWGLTDDVTAVISNECLAVNIDELGDELLGELGMRSEAAEGDVLRPLILH